MNFKSDLLLKMCCGTYTVFQLIGYFRHLITLLSSGGILYPLSGNNLDPHFIMHSEVIKFMYENERKAKHKGG